MTEFANKFIELKDGDSDTFRVVWLNDFSFCSAHFKVLGEWTLIILVFDGILFKLHRGR